MPASKTTATKAPAKAASAAAPKTPAKAKAAEAVADEELTVKKKVGRPAKGAAAAEKSKPAKSTGKRGRPGKASARDDDDGSQAAQGAAGRILVADDNAINARLTARMLRARGFAIDFAEDGRVAVELALTSFPDLILMDCQMPEMDGFEASRTIRAAERQAGRVGVPIVALTAAAFEDDRQRSLDAGMDDHLVRPVGRDVLLAVVARWLAGGRESN